MAEGDSEHGMVILTSDADGGMVRYVLEHVELLRGDPVLSQAVLLTTIVVYAIFWGLGIGIAEANQQCRERGPDVDVQPKVQTWRSALLKFVLA